MGRRWTKNRERGAINYTIGISLSIISFCV